MLIGLKWYFMDKKIVFVNRKFICKCFYWNMQNIINFFFIQGMDFEVNSNEDFYDLLEIFGNFKLVKKVFDIILIFEKFGLFWIKCLLL